MAGILTMLEAAQGGQLFAHVAQSLDLDEAATKAAMEQLCPAIASAIKAKAETDDDLFHTLLDLIEDGSGTAPLEESEALTDAEAVADGNTILNDVYGSRNDAMVALRLVAGDVPERELAKLAPISATAVVAALAQSNQPTTPPNTAMGLAAPLPVAHQDSGGGILGTIIGAVIAGAVSGVVRELTSPKRWSGTTSYSRTRNRRTASSGSSAGRPPISINDIFRGILGNLGK